MYCCIHTLTKTRNSLLTYNTHVIKVCIIHISLCIYICSLNEGVLHGLTMFPTKSHRHIIKSPAQGMRSLLSGCWTLKSKSLPKISQTTAAAFDCLQEIKDKSLLLKIPCIPDTGPGGSELDLNWKLLSEEWFPWYQRHHAKLQAPKKPTVLLRHDTT